MDIHWGHHHEEMAEIKYELTGIGCDWLIPIGPDNGSFKYIVQSIAVGSTWIKACWGKKEINEDQKGWKGQVVMYVKYL